MKTRIRQLREALGMTQKRFAEVIGLKTNTVTTYETTEANPSEATINNICRAFGVRYEWLKFGEGDMFISPKGEEKDELQRIYPNLDPRVLDLISFIANLPSDKQKAMVSLLAQIGSSVTLRDEPETAAAVRELATELKKEESPVGACAV